MYYATVGGDSAWMDHATIFMVGLLAALAGCCHLLHRWAQNYNLDSDELAELQQLTRSTPSVAVLVRAALAKRGRVRVADLRNARAEAWLQERLRAEKALKESVGFRAAE